MKATLLRDMTCRPTEAFPDGVKPAGTTVEDRRAWRLVQMGVATPADDECRRKAGMSPERMEAAQAAYPKVEAGIHPDDYAAYDRGEMLGYNPDGTWIPGPNATEDLELDEEDDEFDEDDDDPE